MIGFILSIAVKVVLGVIAFFVFGLILAILGGGGGGGVRECNTDNIDWDEYDKILERLHPGCTRDKGEDDGSDDECP